MQKLQNLEKQPVEAPQTINQPNKKQQILEKQLKKEKSFPKFNRKTDTKIVQKRRCDRSFQQDQHMCFISPKKQQLFDNSKNFPKVMSPTFSQLTTKFSISKDEIFQFPNTSKKPLKSQTTIQRLNVNNDLQLIKKDQEIAQNKQQIKILRQTVYKLQEENFELKGKILHLQMMEQFLIERENYICQITNRNIELSHQNQLKNNEKLQLENQNKSLNQQLISQKSQRQRLEITNNQLVKHIQKCSQIKNQRHKYQGSANKKLKQNNENIINKKKRSGKSKSVNTGILPKQDRHKKHQIAKDKNLQILTQSLKQIDQWEIDQIQSFTSKQTNSRQNIHTCNEELLSQKFDNNSFQMNIITKQLIQKLKYNEIQIDILKRNSLQSDKLSECNDKLKKQNRKLLNRVNYLTNHFSRKDYNSDSQLQLSLSPSRN